MELNGGEAAGHPVLLQREPLHGLCSQTTRFYFVLFCHKCCTIGFSIFCLQILIYAYAKNKLCPGLMEYVMFYLAIAQRICSWGKMNS